MAVDLSVFGRIKTKQDFDREREAFDLQRQMGQAQVRKAMQFDVDALGERAFMKAAMGEELTPQERAAAAVVDAKSGGVVFNPVTGQMTQKPRMSEKINLGEVNSPTLNNPMQPNPYGGMGNPAISQGYGDIVPSISESDLGMPTPTSPIPMPQMGGAANLNPVNQRDLFKQNVEADRKRLDEIITSAGSANKAKSTAQRMQTLQSGLGYTGTGAPFFAAVDKILTPLNAPDLISGNPADRENFAKESVSDWVTQVEPLKGALTEQEGARFDKATANLSMTPEGIKKMTDLTIALGERASQKSQFYQDYFQQNGTLYGADSIWEQWSSQNPITVLEDSMGKATPKITDPAIKAETIFKAKKAIREGADAEKVRQRLMDAGIDPSKAGL